MLVPEFSWLRKQSVREQPDPASPPEYPDHPLQNISLTGMLAWIAAPSPEDFQPPSPDDATNDSLESAVATLERLLHAGSNADSVRMRLAEAATGLRPIVHGLLFANCRPGAGDCRFLRTALQNLHDEAVFARQGADDSATGVASILSALAADCESTRPLLSRLPPRKDVMGRELRAWHGRLVEFASRLLPHAGEASATLDMGAHMDTFRERWPWATLADFTAIVARLHQIELRPRMLNRIEAELARRRIAMNSETMTAWLALLRPDLFPQWPGLERFEGAFTAAYRRDPRVLRDHESFVSALSEAATPAHAGPSVLLFTASYGRPAVEYIAWRLAGVRIEPAAAMRLLRRRGAGRYGPLSLLIQAHAEAIRHCVGTLCARGFATHSSEIHLALGTRRVRLSRRQISLIPEVLHDIERVGCWFFPTGQAPLKLHYFRLNTGNARLFRGDSPGAVDAPARRRRPADDGCCQALLSAYPEGFTEAQAVQVLAQLFPMQEEARHKHQICAWIELEMLAWIGAGLLMVNPDQLCRCLRESVLANCPPRDRWPDVYLAQNRELQELMEADDDLDAHDTQQPLAMAVPDWPVRACVLGRGGVLSVFEAVANACQDETIPMARLPADTSHPFTALLPGLQTWGEPRGIEWVDARLTGAQWSALDVLALDDLLDRAVIDTGLSAMESARLGGKRFYARIRVHGGADLCIFDGVVSPVAAGRFDHAGRGWHALIGVDVHQVARLRAVLGRARQPGAVAPPRQLLPAAPAASSPLAYGPETSGLAAAATKPVRTRAISIAMETQIAQIFEVLATLHATDGLAPYVRTDSALMQYFVVLDLLRRIRTQYPAVCLGVVDDVVKGIAPSRLGEVLQGRQWLLRRPNHHEIARLLKELSAERPLYYCVARSKIASWINRREPGLYCEAADLNAFAKALPRDKKAAEAAIAALVADKRIFLFCINATAHSFDAPAVAEYLALLGLGCNFKWLEMTLDRALAGLRWEDERFVPPLMGRGAAARLCVAEKIMRRLGLAVGCPAPPWADFIVAFEALYSPPECGRKLHYSGSLVMELYMTLSLQLDGERKAPPGTKPSARRRAEDGAADGPPQKKKAPEGASVLQASA